VSESRLQIQGNEPDEPHIEIHKTPMLDTGIGQSMGYANDAEFIAAAQAEREAALELLTPEARATIEAAEAELERRLLFGEQP
jgi:hypothetical protein